MTRRGRPPAFTDATDLEQRCDTYLDRIDAEEKFVPTIHGLATALGISRETLNQYRSKPEFSDVLKKVLSAISSWWEARLAENACTGAIFWLKNHGWADKTQTEISGGINSVR